MDWHELGLTAARAVGVYVLMLVVIRLLGKRTIGNFTAFDLLVALMLGEIVDEAIYGDVDFIQAVTAILVIAAAKYATAWITYLSHPLANILEGKPRPIVEHGEMDRKALRAELLSELDAMAMLRLRGVDDVREVKTATLEVDGLLSVIKEDWAQPLQKSDLYKKDERAKAKATKGEPDKGQSTTSPESLGAEE